MTNPEEILAYSESRAPTVAVLFLSMGYSIADDAAVRRLLATAKDAIVSGS